MFLGYLTLAVHSSHKDTEFCRKVFETGIRRGCWEFSLNETRKLQSNRFVFSIVLYHLVYKPVLLTARYLVLEPNSVM
jgi:hypothetical protein